MKKKIARASKSGTSQYAKAWYQSRHEDPDLLKRNQLARQRAMNTFRERHKNDPDVLTRRRAASKKYRAHHRLELNKQQRNKTKASRALRRVFRKLSLARYKEHLRLQNKRIHS